MYFNYKIDVIAQLDVEDEERFQTRPSFIISLVQ